jgi:UDP-N-acetyl-D-glucosamine dehydrogenase
MNYYNSILEIIEKKKAVIGIFGLGYVGLPLATLFANSGFQVIGFEKSLEKVNKIKNKENYISDIDESDFKKLVDSNNLTATLDFSQISKCDALIICVPTPLDKFKKPDMKYIQSVCEDIGKYMKKGTFISLESTTYPTTTEEFMLPIIQNSSSFKYDEEFWLCYSPERVDPGNKEYFTQNTPKVLGGLGERAKKIGSSLYSKVIDSIHFVSSPRTAEMVKILENTYRLVNISLMNELALLSGRMNIDIWEVIEAAKTKPFGYQAFYPGPGIGGHCIPLDPFYLEYIAKNFNFDLTMINTAGQIDNLMAHRMMIKINLALNRQKKPINGSKILFLGVAYKPNINDERESPALKIIDEVKKKSGEIYYSDPFIPKITTTKGHKFESVTLNPVLLQSMDCVVITTNHSLFNYDEIFENSRLIVDLRNAIKKRDEKVFKL